MAKFGFRSNTSFENSSTFWYLPLSGEAEEIGLLCITMGKHVSGSVDCNLFHTSLRAACLFLALSYCWGQHVLDRDVRVNGQLMHITESVAAALESLQKDHKEVII
jgi:hypothetical protein